MEEQQLHVVILSPGTSKDSICLEISRLGGSTVEEVEHPLAVLANLSLLQAQSVASIAGIRHVGLVGLNRQVRKLRIKLGPDKRPLWRYEVRDNSIIRVDENDT